MMLQASDSESSESDSSEGVDPAELSSSGRSGDTLDTLAEIANQGWREVVWRHCEFGVRSQISILSIEIDEFLFDFSLAPVSQAGAQSTTCLERRSVN